MKIRIWLKVAQTDPVGLVEKIILLSSALIFPDRSIYHYYMLYFILLKRKKHINHLYAFRKEQHIKNHFHYHWHNYHHNYHHQ